MSLNAEGRPWSISARLRNFLVVLDEYGPARTVMLYLYRMQDKLRDRRLGIDAGGFVGAPDMGFDKEYNDYEPVNYRCLDQVFHYLTPIGEDEVFIEYGSGKGRVMALAALYPFRRGIGVELSGDLNEAARRNIARIRPRRRCRDLELLTHDATTYEVPDDVSLAFLFNPMIGEALKALLTRLRESVERAPRPLRIVYLQSGKGSNQLDHSSWLRRVAELPMPSCQYTLDRRNTLRLFVYETAPAWKQSRG